MPRKSSSICSYRNCGHNTGADPIGRLAAPTFKDHSAVLLENSPTCLCCNWCHRAVVDPRQNCRSRCNAGYHAGRRAVTPCDHRRAWPARPSRDHRCPAQRSTPPNGQMAPRSWSPGLRRRDSPGAFPVLRCAASCKPAAVLPRRCELALGGVRISRSGLGWPVCLGELLTATAYLHVRMPGWSGVERGLDLHRHRGGVAGRAGRGSVTSSPPPDQHCREA